MINPIMKASATKLKGFNTMLLLQSLVLLEKHHKLNCIMNLAVNHVNSGDVSQPTFRRQINVVSTLWINVEITLIRRWKWNKIRRRFLNVAQRWYNVGVRRWNNVDRTLCNAKSTLFRRRTTSFQRWFNVDYNLISTFFQRGLDVI